MGYKPKYYDIKDMVQYLEDHDLSLKAELHKNGGKIRKVKVTSPHARKPFMIEELSSGYFCVYEQHTQSKRYISIHKTHRGVLGRINHLIDRYSGVLSRDDISSFD